MLKTIQSQLSAGLVISVFAIVVVGAVSYSVRHTSDGQVSDLATNQVPATLALGRASTSLVELQLAGQLAISARRDATLRTDAVTAEAHANVRREAARDALDAALADFGAHPMQGEESEQFRKLTAKVKVVETLDERLWRAIAGNDVPLTNAQLVAIEPAYQEAFEVTRHLAALQTLMAAATMEAADRARWSSDITLLVGIVLALAVLLTAGIQLSRTVIGRLNSLRQVAARVAVGELDVEFGARHDDEIGVLNEALRGAVDGTRAVVDLATTVASGDTEVAVTPRGQDDALAAAVNTVAGVLRDAARQANLIADGDYRADIRPRSQKDLLGIALRKMTGALRDAARDSADSDWLKSGLVTINNLALGEESVRALAAKSVSAIIQHLNAQVGALYALDQNAGDPVLKLIGTYAYTERKHLASEFRLGEGLVGQAAIEKKIIVLQNPPDDYVRVVSGLGTTAPRAICVVPILFQDALRGVLEVATLEPLEGIHQRYLQQVAGVLGVSFEIATAQSTLRAQQEELRCSNEELHEQTRALEQASGELQAQQAELEQTNAELEVQMRRTQDSEGRLKTQQRELATTNAQLETRNSELERQKAEIEHARRDLSVQAEELAIASKYKSEFLANMSHELRTPLNSLLLLARSLRDDAEGNLTTEQRESASVIFASGNDLLNLINEILDLSKIEAGRMDLRMETAELEDLSQTLVRQFDHMAKSQGLTLSAKVESGVPDTIVTDPNRLGQVLKNLMGNAIKFTERGSVTLTFGRPSAADRLTRPGLSADHAIAIRVADTGIGIPLDKQRIVFEAFQQADSGDRRKYGGTGLGLSISRELVALLGGEILLRSEPGVGSTFTIVIPETTAPTETRAVRRSAAALAMTPSEPPLPLRSEAPASGPGPSTAQPSTAQPSPAQPSTPASNASTPSPPATARPALTQSTQRPILPDDRHDLQETDHAILIIEDDARLVGVLIAEIHRRGFKCLAALNGKDGIALAKSFRPSGILLDINLPDTTGWVVLSALKQDIETRHIPVHIMSADEATLEGLRIGAIGHAHKPLRTEDVDAMLSTIARSSANAEKFVLVVEDDPIMRRETVRIIGNGTVHVKEVGTGADALAQLREHRFDLMVLDLGLPDMQGLDLLKAASAERVVLPPIIVYTVRELTSSEELALRHYADSIIIKDVRSQERLIDEVALFLHRVVSDLPEEKRQTIRRLYESDDQLRGKKVLIVEDDMRTMFAMAKLLAGHGINPLKAANGEQALVVLNETPSVDLVLLDMMMPVMDGYEAARAMRRDSRFGSLPVIALTAKAMKEDRQRCIDAGCSDYLTKPVDQDRLLSLLRVWLSR